MSIWALLLLLLAAKNIIEATTNRCNEIIASETSNYWSAIYFNTVYRF